MFDLDSYLAGFFDGEGCVSVQFKSSYRGRGPYTRLVVSVGGIDRRPLGMLQERFGGSVGRYASGDKRVIFQWFVSGSSAIPALMVLSKQCVIKAEQARLGLEIAQLMLKTRSSGRRKANTPVLAAEEIARRTWLAERVTNLKYADA